MPKIFITHVAHDESIDMITATLRHNELPSGAAHAVYVLVKFNDPADPETTEVEISLINPQGMSHPFVNDAVFAASAVMKLDELTTPETAIPLVIDVTEPILLIEW